MTFAAALQKLQSKGAYAQGRPRSRWGELLRTAPVIENELRSAKDAGTIKRLDELGTVRGGAVTRANAYFLVREIGFAEIPGRLRITRSDYSRTAVIEDGLGVLSKVEREYLKPIIKGPEALLSAHEVRRSDERLFDVSDSLETLRDHGANNAIAYLKRGTTVDYRSSDDDLKGGIPSTRSQVKNRKPYWYSIAKPVSSGDRIVLPEHIHRRYVATKLEAADSSVVIDKLFVFSPDNQSNADVVHAALNSLLSWYQFELRGRSQLGEGVLELKIPDYSGVFVLDPSRLTAAERRELLDRFNALSGAGTANSLDELGGVQRLAFDCYYLQLCGLSASEELAIELERELRALANERSERKLSVADAKISKRNVTSVAASIDAFAAKVASATPPFPDPRNLLRDGDPTVSVHVTSQPETHIEIGESLFNQGEVLSGGVTIAQAGTIGAAQFVRGALLADPALTQIAVPGGAALDRLLREWHEQRRAWQVSFDGAFRRIVIGVDDPRTRHEIRVRALRLLHAGQIT